MDVEIDNCRALDAVRFLRVARRDGRVIEEAEAHRARRLGVVSGRACRNERIRRFAGHHFIDCKLGSADGPQGRLEAAW